jgi:hypothetical protein
MVKEGLTLLIRSHEGLDARKKRPDNDRLDSMDRGHTTDCDVVVEGERWRSAACVSTTVTLSMILKALCPVVMCQQIDCGAFCCMQAPASGS